MLVDDTLGFRHQNVLDITKIPFEEMKDSQTKLWIALDVVIDKSPMNFASELTKYIYRFDGKRLNLTKQKLSFDEYMFLVDSKYLEDVTLCNITVKHLDGSFAVAKNLLNLLWGVKKLK